MKWVTHQTVAVGAAFMLGMPLVGLGAAWLGGILPDVLDQKRAALSRNPQKTFNRIHRGATHWFGWWVALWVLGLALAPSPWFMGQALLTQYLSSIPPEFGPALAGLGFGAFSHIVLDSCTTSGVPLTPFSRKNKFSFKLCRTGGAGEYVALAIFCIVFWLLESKDVYLLGRAARFIIGL